MAIRTIYTGDAYQGYVIKDGKRRNAGKVTDFYFSMLGGIHKLGINAINTMTKPQMLMVSFAFTEDYSDHSISNVVNRIRDVYRKPKKGKLNSAGKLKKSRKLKNTFNLQYLWARETKFITHESREFNSSLTSEEKAGYSLNDCCPVPFEHYHLILILDGDKGRIGAAKYVMDRLVKNHKIVRAGYHISKDGQDGSVNKITNLKDSFEEFMYRAAYVCKTDTKDIEDSRRMWAMSQ